MAAAFTEDPAFRAHLAKFASLDPETQARMMASAIALRTAPRVNINKLLPSGHLVLENNCVLTAFYNQHMYSRTHGRQLRLVVGSLGLGVTTLEQQAQAQRESDILLAKYNVWWEWGGPRWKTAADFQLHQVPGRFDGHVWLVQDATEDDPVPRIYDILPKSVWRLAKLNGRQLVAPEPTEEQAALVFEGKTASDCARLGFQYVEASTSVTKDILKMYKQHYGSVTDQVLDAFTSTVTATSKLVKQ